MILAKSSKQVVNKINIVFFFAIFPKNEVIIDFPLYLISTSLPDEKIFKSEGNKRKVIKKDIIKPKVIIQPKSIIGLIPLNI